MRSLNDLFYHYCPINLRIDQKLTGIYKRINNIKKAEYNYSAPVITTQRNAVSHSFLAEAFLFQPSHDTNGDDVFLPMLGLPILQPLLE